MSRYTSLRARGRPLPSVSAKTTSRSPAQPPRPTPKPKGLETYKNVCRSSGIISFAAVHVGRSITWCIRPCVQTNFLGKQFKQEKKQCWHSAALLSATQTLDHVTNARQHFTTKTGHEHQRHWNETTTTNKTNHNRQCSQSASPATRPCDTTPSGTGKPPPWDAKYALPSTNHFTPHTQAEAMGADKALPSPPFWTSSSTVYLSPWDAASPHVTPSSNRTLPIPHV